MVGRSHDRVTSECVQDLPLVGGVQQAPVLLLCGESQKAAEGVAQSVARNDHAVEKAASPAPGAQAACDYQLAFILSQQLAHALGCGAHVLFRQVKHRLDHGLVPPGAEEVVGGPLSQQQSQRLSQQSLAGAGLTCEHR